MRSHRTDSGDAWGWSATGSVITVASSRYIGATILARARGEWTAALTIALAVATTDGWALTIWSPIQLATEIFGVLPEAAT